MLISKKWLQTHFDQELPSMQKISDTLLLHSFEIEGLEEKDGDWVLDIDVLPNRAHDCLCHQGIAQELSGLLEIPLKQDRYSSVETFKHFDTELSIHINEAQKCYRYTGAFVSGVEVRESPDWLKKRMSSLGQKSINALVDAANYVMFDLGQPMHIFDADKVVGALSVRNAKEGEYMMTLTGEELSLQEDDLVIADEEKVLALAGIKGGRAAEVSETTQNIIIESANFNPQTTRKTAQRVKIFTDASKRYENGLSSEKAPQALSAILALIIELAATETTKIRVITDVYPNPEEVYTLSFTKEQCSRLLGFSLSSDEINKILHRFHYSYSENDGVYQVAIPPERLDLRIPEDMIEEIGRIYGYHKIPIISLDEIQSKPQLNRDFFLEQTLRNYFVEKGFIEIMNYTFVQKGVYELLNPFARDKKALRKNLSQQMKISLEKNAQFTDFVNIPQVKLFEIDRVHTKNGEEKFCCFGINTLSKKSRKEYGSEDEQLQEILDGIKPLLKKDEIEYEREGGIVSLPLQQFSIEEEVYGEVFHKTTYSEDAHFKGISPYPYIKRDVSFWIQGESADALKKLFEREQLTHLKKIYLFDTFEKEGRTSYAFSFIFQSNEQTLTDKEVNYEIEKIYRLIEEKGGELR